MIFKSLDTYTIMIYTVFIGRIKTPNPSWSPSSSLPSAVMFFTLLPCCKSTGLQWVWSIGLRIHAAIRTLPIQLSIQCGICSYTVWSLQLYSVVSAAIQCGICSYTVWYLQLYSYLQLSIGPEGPSRWPKATSPPQELEVGACRPLYLLVIV